MSNADTSKVKDTESTQKEKKILAELKNGKIIFKQKTHSFEKHSETLQELVNFRDMLHQRFKSKTPLTELEDQYKPLIVKMAHESDKTLNSLAKHIHAHLVPSDEDEDEDLDASTIAQIFPVSVIEKAIQAVAHRNNYGLELESTKIPTALCIWRWEAKESFKDSLPKAALEKTTSRVADRVQAKKEILDAFNRLPEAEQAAILPNRNKPGKEAGNGPTPNEAGTSTGSPSKQADSNEADGTKSKVGRPKKSENVERNARVKKQNDAQKNLMANFFSKPKNQADIVNRKASSSKSVISDFEKTFKPFVRKKDTEIAPLNAFLSAKPRQATGTNKYIIDVDSIDEPQSRLTQTVHNLSVQERLHDVLSALPDCPSYRPPRSSHYKTFHSPTVRKLVERLSEAEVTDDTQTVRSIQHTLASRQAVPAKALIFHEDNRPGYFGTWTRNSRIIGARTPFSKDVVEMEYGYDSGEEWEDGDAGDAEDVVDDDDEEHNSEEDSDMDDWLVDDDDEVEESVPPPDDFDPLLDVTLPTKRKADDDKKTSKKRKVVVPLVPYVKGPCWEQAIGECKDATFNSYQIHFFGDASYSLDPFTYVSSVNQKTRRHAPAQAQTDPVFAVPSLPNRVGTDPSVPPAPNNTPTVKKAAPPKTVFPEDHLPVLREKVNTLQAASLTFLVDSVFQELRVHKVKKNAIEAKIKEIGMKCMDKKVWVLRQPNAVGQPNAPSLS